jgi:glutamine amidotransferase
MIAIIDYGMGNLRSLKYKLDRENINSVVTYDHKIIRSCDKIILPGVGNFKKAMSNLDELELIDFLNEEVVVKSKPVLGICLGMQLLTNYSEEGNVKGLAWIDAETIKFNFNDNKYKIPHVGWNNLEIIHDHQYLNDISDKDFYFTHSYYVKCKNTENIIAKSKYGLEFDSVINKDNIFGTQFHPEKSHKTGFNLIINFSLN